MRVNATVVWLALDEWDKLVVVVGAVCFLLMVLLVLTCVLNQDCWLHQMCVLEEDTVDNKSERDVSKDCWQAKMSIRDIDLPDWSDMGVQGIVEMKKDKISAFKGCPSPASSSQPGHGGCSLSFSLHWDLSLQQLTIRVVGLDNMKVTGPDSVMAPYVKVRLYRSPNTSIFFKSKKKELSQQNLVAEFQTRILRRADNPVYNESFSCELTPHDVRSGVIKLSVCDMDQFSRHVVIGEVVCDLKKVNFAAGNEVVFKEVLAELDQEDLGELQVALMYLPTAEKLSLTVLSARSLRLSGCAIKNIEVYTKMTLMFEGRALKKTRTTSREGVTSPIFNETCVFDVPIHQLDKVYFSLALVQVQKNRETDSGHHLLGRVYIGVQFEQDSRAQWCQMVQNARKQVICWHQLRY